MALLWTVTMEKSRASLAMLLSACLTAGSAAPAAAQVRVVASAARAAHLPAGIPGGLAVSGAAGKVPSGLRLSLHSPGSTLPRLGLAPELALFGVQAIPAAASARPPVRSAAPEGLRRSPAAAEAGIILPAPAKEVVPISSALTRLAGAARKGAADPGGAASVLKSFYSGGAARLGASGPADLPAAPHDRALRPALGNRPAGPDSASRESDPAAEKMDGSPAERLSAYRRPGRMLSRIAARVGTTLRRWRNRFTRRARIAALIRENEDLLDEIQRRAFLFFWENTDPKSGLTRDRAGNFAEKETRSIASIAATGFGLVALGIAHSRGWITYDQAYDRTLVSLKGVRSRQNEAHGWSYHFMDLQSGERSPHSEVSSIDTALFLVGAVFAARYFRGTEIERLAEGIYRKVDFPWMMTDGGTKSEEKMLSMGWTPEGGFLKTRWHEYSEHMILAILGMGSPTFPLPPEAWHAWTRYRGSYAGLSSIASGPLFTHQYAHMAIDFRGRRDGYADYFQNSVTATMANRRFAINQMGEYSTYGPDSWGLTASDGPDGYRAYGAPPGRVEHDGTVAPTAAGGSIVFTPEYSIRALRFFLRNYGDRIWGRYGFSDSFNTDPSWKDRFNVPGMWRSPDAVGIDQGAMLLMIENLRTGLVWKTIMSSPHIRRGMRAAGLRRR